MHRSSTKRWLLLGIATATSLASVGGNDPELPGQYGVLREPGGLVMTSPSLPYETAGSIGSSYTMEHSPVCVDQLHVERPGQGVRQDIDRRPER